MLGNYCGRGKWGANVGLCEETAKSGIRIVAASNFLDLELQFQDDPASLDLYHFLRMNDKVKKKISSPRGISKEDLMKG